jgi:hypothetical protein
VLELLRGDDFATVLVSSPDGLAIDEALSYGAQVADGLAAAHAAGVVHRDIKPSNLVLLPGGRVKICDFGIAHLPDVTGVLTVTGQAIGTPAYMAPEQWGGRGVDGRADLYSLGCVLWELVSGQRLFIAGRLPGALPTDLGSYLLRLTAEDPAQRPASAAAVAAELRAISERHQKASEALDSRVRKLLADAENIARLLPHEWDKAEILRTIAGVTAQRDPAKARYLLADAEGIARNLGGALADWELRRIAAVAAVLDQADATRIIGSLDDLGNQIRILVKHAQAIRERDPAGARQLLGYAAHVTQSRVQPGRQCGELLHIAEVTAEMDVATARDFLAAAERDARTNADPDNQCCHLWPIASATAALDPEHARKILADATHLADTITDVQRQDTVLRCIAEVMVGVDPAAATDIAHTITDPQGQVEALREIAQVTAASDLDRARQLLSDAERIAHTIGGHASQFPLMWLADAAAGVDLDLAEHIARTISDRWKRSLALLMIGRKAARENSRRALRLLDEAREAAPGDHLVDEIKLLCAIAEEAAERDLGKVRDLLAEPQRVGATVTGDMVHNDSREVLAREMAKIASIVLRRDRAEAERIARTILIPSIRDGALRDIAMVIAGHDQAGAARIISALDPGTSRDEATVRIIETIAAKDPEHAERISDSAAFNDHKHQAMALIGIADAATWNRQRR